MHKKLNICDPQMDPERETIDPEKEREKEREGDPVQMTV